MDIKPLKEYHGSAEYELIDIWTHQYIESLPYDEAIAKYGDCDVWGTYTSGYIKNGGFVTSVWIMIPGQHIYNEYGEAITIDEHGVQITKTRERK